MMREAREEEDEKKTDLETTKRSNFSLFLLLEHTREFY